MAVQFDDDSGAPSSSGSVVFDDEQPSYAGDVVKNAGKELAAIPGSLPGMAKQALGVASAPMDALKAIPQMIGGKDLADTDIAQDVKPIIQGNESTVNTVEHPVESFRKAPINTAGTALGLAGGFGELVPHGTITEVPQAAEMAGDAEKAAPAVPPAAETPKSAPLKDLPVMQPGVKTGPPHALFAYNDTFGPDGTPRSIYNVFGDPGHPEINAVGGYGTSVTKDILDKAGVPIIGREPRSVGKWEPLDAGATPPPNEAGGAKPGPEAVPPPSGSSMIDNAAKAAQDAAKEVKDYVTRGYSGYAKKPGAIADVADWVQEKSQMMAAQQMGFTPNQARQLARTPLEGHNAMRAIGQYALDNDIVSPTTGLSGMLEKNAALQKAAGKTIGDYRAMADKLAGEIDPKDVAKQVQEVLDKKYMRGVTDESGPRGAYSGQSGAYLKAIQEIEDAAPSHSGIAEASTELNHAANKAAKNQQPETPFTDVANEVSRINNERVKQLIGPENAAKYEQALRDFGVNKKIGNALKFKSSGEVKRFGPGSTVSNLTQKAMDELGYRVGAKTANKLSTAIKNNPGVAGNLPSLFKEFINQVEDVGHDVTGMAKGGIVPDDVKRYVFGQC